MAKKTKTPKDFDKKTIERAGRLLLGWSGIHPRCEKELDQFLDAVNKSSAPEVCADVTFAITGEVPEDMEEILDIIREHDPEDEVTLCEIASRRGFELTLDQATRYMEKSKSDGEDE